MEACILPAFGYDHWPICHNIEFQSMPYKRPFKFEKFLAHASGFPKEHTKVVDGR
jgi:hypothetical protein